LAENLESLSVSVTGCDLDQITVGAGLEKRVSFDYPFAYPARS
jgi:hypothetical protein